MLNCLNTYLLCNELANTGGYKIFFKLKFTF
jgi:hypothetical protein